MNLLSPQHLAQYTRLVNDGFSVSWWSHKVSPFRQKFCLPHITYQMVSFSINLVYRHHGSYSKNISTYASKVEDLS